MDLFYPKCIEKIIIVTKTTLFKRSGLVNDCSLKNYISRYKMTMTHRKVE